jgi:hypothetical protein
MSVSSSAIPCPSCMFSANGYLASLACVYGARLLNSGEPGILVLSNMAAEDTQTLVVSFYTTQPATVPIRLKFKVLFPLFRFPGSSHGVCVHIDGRSQTS